MCYRKIVVSNSLQARERLVFEDSYTEFLMHAQFLGRKRNTELAKEKSFFTTISRSHSCIFDPFIPISFQATIVRTKSYCILLFGLLLL